MQESYFAAIWRFARRGFVLRTDAMQIILASLVPAYFQITGTKMPEGTVNIVLSYIAYATIGFVVIRLLTAPYFLWKEQNSKIQQLEYKLNEPQRQAAAIQAEYITRLKIDLSSAIARLTTIVLSQPTINNPSHIWGALDGDIDAAKAKIEELSHNSELWERCNETIHLISLVELDKQR